jgi:flagellar hook-associated protein 2
MSSPITLSGFNSIDFNTILNAIMQQERQPVVALESQKKALESQRTAFGTLASKLASLESAVERALAPDALAATTATASDPTRLAVAAGAGAPAGSFEVYVDQLAGAQVTTSVGAYADAHTTAVAGAGTLRFTTAAGGVDVVLSGDVTLQGLADAINATAGAPVSASVFRNADGKYQLMLTGASTGAEHAFSVDAGALSPPGGGAAMQFDEVQGARDARVRVNGVTATSASNTFDGVINGLSFTALQQDAANPVVVTITADPDSVVNLVQKLIAAFNDTTSWIGSQTASAAQSDANSIGRDPLVRGLRTRLTAVMTASYEAGGSYRALAEIGFEFTRSGELTLNETRFREAMAGDRVGVGRLFGGADGSGGVFGSLVEAVEQYTTAGGLVPNAQDRLKTQLRQVSDRISDMEERLAIRRAALQREFAAADATIAQLNSQQGSLGSLSAQYSLF